MKTKKIFITSVVLREHLFRLGAILISLPPLFSINERIQNVDKAVTQTEIVVCSLKKNVGVMKTMHYHL